MTMTDRQKEYLYKYQREKLKRIPLDVTIEKYQQIKQAAAAAKMSVNGFVKAAIEDRLQSGG